MKVETQKKERDNSLLFTDYIEALSSPSYSNVMCVTQKTVWNELDAEEQVGRVLGWDGVCSHLLQMAVYQEIGMCIQHNKSLNSSSPIA